MCSFAFIPVELDSKMFDIQYKCACTPYSLYIICKIVDTIDFLCQDALPLTVVEAAFGSSEENVGNRDYRIQRVSALKG